MVPIYIACLKYVKLSSKLCILHNIATLHKWEVIIPLVFAIVSSIDFETTVLFYDILW